MMCTRRRLRHYHWWHASYSNWWTSAIVGATAAALKACDTSTRRSDVFVAYSSALEGLRPADMTGDVICVLIEEFKCRGQHTFDASAVPTVSAAAVPAFMLIVTYASLLEALCLSAFGTAFASLVVHPCPLPFVTDLVHWLPKFADAVHGGWFQSKQRRILAAGVLAPLYAVASAGGGGGMEAAAALHTLWDELKPAVLADGLFGLVADVQSTIRWMELFMDRDALVQPWLDLLKGIHKSPGQWEVVARIVGPGVVKLVVAFVTRAATMRDTAERAAVLPAATSAAMDVFKTLPADVIDGAIAGAVAWAGLTQDHVAASGAAADLLARVA